MVKAIVYTSNTGFTAQYAQLLGKQTALPVYTLERAKTELAGGTAILYLGWLMAGAVQGYPAAAKAYQVCAVCAVGMGENGSQMKDVREKNSLDADLPLFVLQGGFDMKKLHGMYKFMMTVMAKTVGGNLAKKQDRTPEEEDMLEMLRHGGSHVCEENLADVLAWVRRQAQEG